MKVVINRCFGGFSLSPEAETAYLARKGKSAFFYENGRTADDRPDFDNYVRLNDPSKARIFAHTLTEDLGPTPTGDELNGSEGWFSARDLKRDDPDLVAVVEELGVKANGQHAELDIVEVPDDVEWEIEEYDGLEHVAETHRVWS